MDIKFLNTFKTIVEEGSFIRAAEKLNYTQSTITFQVGQLEQDLSVKLFEKIGRKMVLTKAGEQLLPYVNNVLESVEKLTFFENDLASYQGDLRVGVAETILCYKIPKVLKEFREKAPKAKLYIKSMNCYEIRNELIAGNLDIGVFYNYVGGLAESVITYPIGEYPLTLLASPKTKEAYSDFNEKDQSIPVPFVINEPNCVFRQIFEEHLRNKKILLDHTIELWSIPTIKNLVKNDVGVTYLPRFAAIDEINDGSLVEIDCEVSGKSITAVCGHHKNKWISPLMELFIELSSKIKDES